MDMPLYPGDPLTPGVGATRWREAPAAQRSQDHHQDSGASDFVWRCAAAAGRAQGPGRAGELARRAADDLSRRSRSGEGASESRNPTGTSSRSTTSIARIPGSDEPDVVDHSRQSSRRLGQRRRRSGFRGRSPQMEEARGLAELLKQGWKPKRTIIYCVWDGEEEGLLGSTEWAEEHAEELRRHAAVYINSDGNGRGFLQMSGLAFAREVHQRRRERHR